MEWEIAIRLLVGAVLVLANAFFVTSEFALTRVRQFPESAFEEHRALRRAWRMTERLEIYLTSCQLGITSTTILLGIVVEPAVTGLLEPMVEAAVGWTGGSVRVASIVLAVVVINLVHKIWGEQAPTYLGVERPRLVIRYTAPALHVWTRVMYPAIVAGDALAKWTLGLLGVEIRRSWTDAEAGEGRKIGGPRELEHRMTDLLARAPLSGDRRREVLAALEIGERTVSEIMVARDEIVALRAARPFEENLEVVASRPHVRFPVIGDSFEDVRGILYVPALFARLDDLRAGRSTLEDLVVDPLWLEAEISIADAIDRFQEERQEVALVREDGRVTGLVTSTDAFEAIIGQLEDPLDRRAGEP